MTRALILIGAVAAFAAVTNAQTNALDQSNRTDSNRRSAAANLENQRYENHFAGVTLAQRITSAANDCGFTECIIVIPSDENGALNTGYPAYIPDTAVIWDQRQGGMGTFIATPGNCSRTAGFLNIQIGAAVPAGQAGGIATQCVGEYIAVKPADGMDSWGSNTIAVCRKGRECWGYETDIAPEDGVNQAVGFDSVAAGSGQAKNMPAFRCLTTINIVPVGGWKNCLEVQGVTDTAFLFLDKDSGMRLVQTVVASATPQIVETNGNCTNPPFSQLYIGTVLSVDSGDQQEDVRILNVGCDRVAKVTAVFRKNHKNSTSFTEYGAQRIWDAQNVVTNEQNPYLWGSIRKYNESHTPNVLGFGVIDSSGVSRLTEFYTSNDIHAWRDVSTTGFIWQSQAGMPIASLSDRGMYSPSSYGTQTNCAIRSPSPASCGSAPAGVVVVPSGMNTYTVNSTAVTANSRIFLSPTTDVSGLPLGPACVEPSAGTIVQTARFPGVGFTVRLPSTSGAVCLNFWIVN